jgi:hypothetical protein
VLLWKRSGFVATKLSSRPERKRSGEICGSLHCLHYPALEIRLDFAATFYDLQKKQSSQFPLAIDQDKVFPVSFHPRRAHMLRSEIRGAENDSEIPISHSSHQTQPA